MKAETSQEESCGLAAVGVFALAALLFASIVEATHEVDHRYLVLGYVRDRAGRREN